MDFYLSKPIDRAFLVPTVSRWLSRTAKSPAWPHDQQYSALDVHLLGDLEVRFGQEKVRRFIASVRKQIDVVMKLLEADGAREELGDGLHDLVSIAGHVGLRDLSARSRELMIAVRTGSDNASALAAELKLCARQSISDLDMRYPDMAEAT